MSTSLTGQVIVNTRPAHQQAELTALLEAEGARVQALPAIAIVASDDSQRAQIRQQFDRCDIALFVSRNAVEAVFRFIDCDELPPATQIGVIGASTQQSLAQQMADRPYQLISAEPFNSEGLLDAAALQSVAGKAIVIFRGQQGRNLLGDELSRRGARVGYCEVYRRELPEQLAAAITETLQMLVPTLIVLTSNEGMHNLIEQADTASRKQLMQIPWLLISERMRESALKLGHNASIVIAASPSDRGIKQSICDWADQR